MIHMAGNCQSESKHNEFEFRVMRVSAGKSEPLWSIHEMSAREPREEFTNLPVNDRPKGMARDIVTQVVSVAV